MTPEQLRDIEKHQVLVNAISAMLAGNSPAVQCSVLADLVAMWIAGHQPGNSAVDIEKEREGLIAFFVAGMRKMIGMNDAIVKETMMAEAKGETLQ